MRVFGFSCPECRKVIRIPRPDEPSNEWANQINKDFKLAGILTAVKKGALEAENVEKKDDAEALPERIDKIEIQTQTTGSEEPTTFQPVPVSENPQSGELAKPNSIPKLRGNFVKVIEVNDRVRSQGLCDLTVLVQGKERIIVTPDLEEKQLLTFKLNEENQVVKSKAIELTSKPWRICKVNETQVAVTGSEPNGVMVITIKDGISIDRFIKTHKHYDGIASLPEKFVLTTKDNVDIIRAHDGKVLFDCKVSTPNVRFPDISYAACTTTENILVTDLEAKLAFCINQEGKTLWKKKMKNPLGVACDASGQVFFVDHEASVVYLFTIRGRVVCKVVEKSDQFTKPSGIAVDNLGYLYVICNYKTITVWKLTRTED